jgi:hypothetical protein
MTTAKTPAAVATPASAPVKDADTLAIENASVGMTKQEIVAAIKAAPKRGELPENVKTALAERKNLHLVAAKMSEMNWGRGLDELTRRAVAAYLERNRLDLTEIDVLGGNLYRNSRYYKRRLAEKVEDGMIDYLKSDWVHPDPRLASMAAQGDEWARAEQTRRARVRIEYGIPDAAIGACVFRIKVKGMDVEITAAKWCGGGTQKKRASGGAIVDGDPIGDLFPVETSETRACRRAAILVASSIPALKWQETELDEQGVAVASIIKEGKSREVFAEPPRRHALAEGDYATPDPLAAAEMKPIPVEETEAERLAFDRAIVERDG